MYKVYKLQTGTLMGKYNTLREAMAASKGFSYTITKG